MARYFISIDAAASATSIAAASASTSAAPVIPLTAEIIRSIAPSVGDKAAAVAKNLNTTLALAGIKTALAEAMFIAQVAVETGGFANEVSVEKYTDSIVVYHPGPGVPDALLEYVSISRKKERYLHGGQVTKWKHSRELFKKAVIEYNKTASPKDSGDGSLLIAAGKWKAIHLTDYYPGDKELPFWQKWYDPGSPDSHRAQFAKNNGNTLVGDGKKYIGRGDVQLTWKSNYKAAGDFIGVNLVANPEMAAEPANAIKIAAWFWKTRGGNNLAKTDSAVAFKKVCKAINGGEVGIDERQTYFTQVKAIFKAVTTTPAIGPLL